MNLEHWIERGYELLLIYGPRLIAAIIIWIVGSWFAQIILKWLKKGMEKAGYDVSIQDFLLNLIYWAFKILLIIIVLSTMGIESTSFVAVLASAGLAVGLALQGSLSNFAGGVLILIIKPFRVGDFISAQGVDGTVKAITIFNTKLATSGNQVAILPNGKLSNENIINYSAEGTRRDSITYSISYESNIKIAKEVILNLVNEQPQVLQDEGKKPMVVVSELAENSVNITLRFWAKNADFWNLHWLFLEEGKLRLEAQGIDLPYPQRKIHVVTTKED